MPMITVPLGQRTYPIHIGSGMLDCLGTHVLEMHGEISVAIVTDDNVAPLYLDRAVKSLENAGLRVCSIVLPHGEQTKCLSRLTELYDFLCESRITRKDAVIALGGGVIGDLTGLAAATFLRGVHFIQVPTTLLAQVDSSVGGKVAVDLPQGKNLVGAFYQPDFVLVDPDTLRTLTDEFWRDGLGEVVKYGCIGDAELFALLEECAPGGREKLMQQIDTILMHCIQAKADVVAQDERDMGLRMTLNFPRGGDLPALHGHAPWRGGGAGHARHDPPDGSQSHDRPRHGGASGRAAAPAGYAHDAAGHPRGGADRGDGHGQEIRRKGAAGDRHRPDRQLPDPSYGCNILHRNERCLMATSDKIQQINIFLFSNLNRYRIIK